MQFYTAKETASMLAMSTQRLANLRHEGRGPAYVKMEKSIRYNRDDIIRYMAERRISTNK